MSTDGTVKAGMGAKTLIAFFSLAFGMGWGLASLPFLFPDKLAFFGPMGYTNPLFILAVYSPALAGLFLVWRHYGLKGMGSFLRRVTLWRMPVAWWVFLLAGIPAIVYLGAAIKGTATDPFPFSPWYTMLPALAVGLVIGPIEEFGWRGVALPILQRRFAPIWSSLIVGSLWGLWHMPAFFLSGTPQSSWSFGPFVVGVLALSIVLTAMFNAGRGSILIAALFHWQINSPLWPDAQPWDSLVWVMVAIVVVVMNRKTMFSKGGSVTEVLSSPQPGNLEHASVADTTTGRIATDMA